MIRPTAIPNPTFENKTSLFCCEPCNTGDITPAPERGGYAWQLSEPWQRVKLPDTPYQLKPLVDSAPPTAAGGYMAEIDERVRGSAVTDNARQDRESLILLIGAIALCAVCLYCKITDPVPRPSGEQELSLAQYQEQMRRAKAEKPGEEPRPAVRIPELKNRTREGRQP